MTMAPTGLLDEHDVPRRDPICPFCGEDWRHRLWCCEARIIDELCRRRSLKGIVRFEIHHYLHFPQPEDDCRPSERLEQINRKLESIINNMAKQSDLDALEARIVAKADAEKEQVREAILELKALIENGEPIDLAKFEEVVSGRISGIYEPDAGTPAANNGVVGFKAKGKAIVSGKFECRNDDVEQMAFLNQVTADAIAAVNAQAPGGAELEGSIYGTLTGTLTTLPINNLHQLLKAQQSAINALKEATDAQCAQEGI